MEVHPKNSASQTKLLNHAVLVLECGFAIAPWKIGVYLGSALIAELAHPLMATYALSRVALFLTVSLPDRKRPLATICGLMLFVPAAAACIFCLTPPQKPEYIRAAQTRAYGLLIPGNGLPALPV